MVCHLVLSNVYITASCIHKRALVKESGFVMFYSCDVTLTFNPFLMKFWNRWSINIRLYHIYQRKREMQGRVAWKPSLEGHTAFSMAESAPNGIKCGRDAWPWLRIRNTDSSLLTPWLCFRCMHAQCFWCHLNWLFSFCRDWMVCRGCSP